MVLKTRPPGAPHYASPSASHAQNGGSSWGMDQTPYSASPDSTPSIGPQQHYHRQPSVHQVPQDDDPAQPAPLWLSMPSPILMPSQIAQEPIGSSASSTSTHTHASQPLQTTPPVLISNELHLRVVQDFALGQESSIRLRAYASLFEKIPQVTRAIAVPVFILLGGVLRGHEMQARHLLQVPTMDAMLKMFEKIENRLNMIPFRLTEYHSDNIRGLSMTLIYDETIFEIYNLADRVYTVLKNRQTEYYLQEAFSTPHNAKILSTESGKIVSSVKNGLREAVVFSVISYGKGKILPLAVFANKMAEKYCGKGQKPTYAVCVKLAMFRRFALENNYVLPENEDAKPKRGTKRKTPSDVDDDSEDEEDDTLSSPARLAPSSSSPVEPSRDAAPWPLLGVELFDDGTMADEFGARIPAPQRPKSTSFWVLWDWYHTRLRKALGSTSSRTPAWKKYIVELIKQDRETFRLQSGHPGMDELDAMLAPSTQESPADILMPQASATTYDDLRFDS
ncbi:hypothetical protein FA13DRAFT_1794689 [Coprinellus micaceus]|uniref:Uncharacterized protein n=1 Tax=Coprinellus micaceus TaxID=71717 RepID=A0A4Y7T064_COPMI|nr:hypothetical protein FA13DRAFT_1796442 [Coprinellus micaceus]TEB27527.1 hypothetical protein FA13DRAFT_1794689 [Coprinellus micaceus]